MNAFPEPPPTEPLVRWILRDHALLGSATERNILQQVPLERMRERPPGTANSILWSLWHSARTEDVALNVVARASRQELLEGGWAARLGGEHRIGTGFGDDEVEELSRTLDARGVVEYWRSVRARTRTFVAAVALDELERIPDVDEGLSAAGDVLGAGSWLRDTWRGWSVGKLLAMPCLNHGFLHLGEMMTVRGMLGIEPPVR